MTWVPGESLLIKIWDSIASGVGAIARPSLIRRETIEKALGDAEALRINRLAEEAIRRELREVRAGRKQIGPRYILLPPPEAEKVVETTAVQKLATDFLQSVQAGCTPPETIEIECRLNLDQIALIALEEAAHEQADTVDEKPIDPDWFAQWRNRAQDISQEEMQRLWARVLKGEAKTGGSYSIHTMDFLSRMSRADAELIARLGTFVVAGRFILKKAKALETAGITTSERLFLNDLAILNSVEAIGGVNGTFPFDVETAAGKAALLGNHDKVLVCVAKPEHQGPLTFPTYVLSQVGRELISLASFASNDAYLKEVADACRAQCLSVLIGSAQRQADGNFTVTNMTPF